MKKKKILKMKKKSTILIISLILVLNVQTIAVFYNFSNELSFTINDFKEDFFDPKIVRPSKIHDRDGDKIADTLSKLINGNIKTTSSPNALRDEGKKVEVMICVNKKPDGALIERFRNLGAEIISVYDNLIYAITAVLPIDKISVVAADPLVTLIEEQAYSTAHLDTSTVNMGVRGSPYVWDATPVIKGNPYYSIAILDTGVDSSHPDMPNFLHFRDFTTHGYLNGSTGVDYGHHGSHCASIAAGTGVTDTDPETVKETFSNQFPSVVNWYYPHWFEVKDNSNNPNTVVTIDWDTSNGGSIFFEVRDSNDNSLTSFGPYTYTPITYNLGNLVTGWYKVYCVPADDFACNRDYTLTVEQEYNYMLSSEPINSPVFVGVAPQSKIVCLKVLDDSGSGIGDWFQEALSWISTNGKNPAYNITTVSMSIGFDGFYSSIDTAVNNLVDEGFICVASAGNGGTNNGNNAINSPGTAQKCITVGAVNDAFEVVYYSSNGDAVYNKPDVIAPGGTIASSGSSSLHNLILATDSNYGEDYNSMSDIISNDYRGMQGTSMACPHVAGLVQLVIDSIIQKEGSWAWSQANALKVKQLICMGTWEVNAGETYDGDGDNYPQNPPLNRVGRDVVEGFGMVRADAVIQAITHPTTGSFTNIPYYLDRRGGLHAQDPKVVLFSIDAIGGETYTFTLNVPSTGDFDLIIYDDNFDVNSGSPLVFDSSINSGLDVDESLIFTPAENGVYFWSIRAVEGYGICQISLQRSVNSPPNPPTNPTPSDGVTGIGINPILSVDVSDPDGNSMNVSFYDASDDSLVDTDYGVSSGGTASVSWSSLSEGTAYSWYVVANDGISMTTSSTWSFNTEQQIWFFNDDFVSSNWQLIDVSNEYFYETFKNEDLNDDKVGSTQVQEGSADENHNGVNYADIGRNNGNYIWKYVKISSNLNSLYLTENDGPDSDILVIYGAVTYFFPNTDAEQTDLTFDVSITSSFDLNTITWNNKPGVGSLLVNDFPFYQYSGYNPKYINLGVRDQNYFALTPSTTKDGYIMHQCSEEHFNSWTWPEIQKQWGKFYQGNGYTYMQSDIQEQLKIRSNHYGQIYDVKDNDIFIIDFEANTDSQITLDLIKEGIIQSSIEIVPNGNSNFNRQTQNIILTETVQFDQLQFSGLVDDKDYFKCYDISLLCRPDTPNNPSPPDGAISVDLNPLLSVDVYDRNGDIMDVSFYDASDDSLIGTDTAIPNGGKALITWVNLLAGTTYSWYAVANDGGITTTSPTWSFTTNFASDAPSNPSPADGLNGIYHNPMLSVDVFDLDGDSMDVSFYDASDDSLIGSDFGISSGGTASITWFGLSEGTIYSWYAVANDGLSLSTSPIWSFRINFAPNAPYNLYPADGATGINLNPMLSILVSDLDGDSMDVSFYDASDDSLIGTNFGVSSGGVASVSWIGLSEETVYSWYAIAYDGISSNTSSTWSFTSNYAPNLITNPVPIDGDTKINLNPTLGVDVFDPDGNSMDVSFYDASDDSFINTDYGVFSGDTASVTWSSLLDGTTYSWYAIANDGVSMTVSSTWSFTTNYAPYTPSNPLPIDGTTGVDINPTLSVEVFDLDGDSMDVSFYDASDHSLIGTDYSVPSGATSSLSWPILSEGISCSWYVVVNDGTSVIASPTWSFTVFIDIPNWEQGPNDQIIEYGDSFNYDLNATDFSGIDFWWLNDTSSFSIDNNGIITNVIGAPTGNYWLDVRAYDPYNNYCFDIIKITIEDTTSPTWDDLLSQIVIEFGEDVYYDFDASDLSGITSWWINNTSSFNIDENGVLVNTLALAGGTYELEVRAYDPYDNFCTINIKVIVEPPESASPVILGYNIVFLICVVSFICILMIKKQLRNKY